MLGSFIISNFFLDQYYKFLREFESHLLPRENSRCANPGMGSGNTSLGLDCGLGSINFC